MPWRSSAPGPRECTRIYACVTSPGVASSSSLRAAPWPSSHAAKRCRPAALRRRVRRSHRVRPRRVGWFATGSSTFPFFASVLQAASTSSAAHRRGISQHRRNLLHAGQLSEAPLDLSRQRTTQAAYTGDSGGHTGSTAASVFTGLRRARKRQRITTRRARDFRTRRAASVTVRTYPQRDNANERRRTSATEPRPRRDDG